MKTEYPCLIKKKVADLTPADYNPRTITDEAIGRLTKSLAELGNLQPITWNARTGRIVGGHQRLKCYQAMGKKEVEVWAVDLSEEKEKAANLALNKLAGEFDPLRLKDLVEQLDTGGMDLEITGFSMDELGEMMSMAPPEIVEDEVPEPPADPITKPGDLWVLGEHRLLCGDSTNAEDVQKATGGAKADVVFTDPPYGVNIQGGKGGKARHIAGDLTQTAIPFSFDLAVSIATTNDARLYFCGSEGNLYLYQKLFEKHCRQLPRHLIWMKNGFAMKPNGYHNQYEIIFHGYKPGGGALSKWFGPRTEEAASDVWRIKRDASSSYEHPTQKPVALPARGIGNSCPPDGLVYEPFGGSGSTFLAAEQLGRKCYGMEISPAYCDVIVKRWETLTGKKAKLCKS